MTIKELRATIESLESIYADTIATAKPPAVAARQFTRAVGVDTATQCVAAMIRRIPWDGRISRTARQWAESIAPKVPERIMDSAYTDRIHPAHLSQIAEAMPADLEHAEAETQPATARYLEQVEQADSLDELDSITETAANDDALTSADYEAIHAAALQKAQEWDPQSKPQQSTEPHKNAVPVESITITHEAIRKALEVLDMLHRRADSHKDNEAHTAAYMEAEHVLNTVISVSTGGSTDIYWTPTGHVLRKWRNYGAKLYEDNAGRLHLAVLDYTGACVYYLVSTNGALVRNTLKDLTAGGDPVAEAWEGGEKDPATAYRWITEAVEARNGGAWKIDPLDVDTREGAVK